MSIKSDKWIRMMANEYRMIEPYEPGQVKVVEGKRIVSYGTSSYGYDIRCADEFKLFTNINSTIVDPKEFDEKNFVDIKGESVIIPPNSFALARTVEYFRIPRNVLTICLGKSTYGRFSEPGGQIKLRRLLCYALNKGLDEYATYCTVN
jgi:dCTP deaminase